VLKAIQLARACGAYTIGWTGFQGGKVAKVVDLSVVVPSDSIEQIEDIHLMMAHMVTIALRNAAQPEFVLQSTQPFRALQAN
jgi:D-sedoheptulose 7-phosphate isomerase